jgi:serine/threonine protein phosphatase PrpC
VCAISDGQGGRPGGALAAETAVHACFTEATSSSAQSLLNPRLWESILSSVDRSVRATEGAGYATLIGLCVSEDGICGASCGDSLVYLSHDGQQVNLTAGQYKHPPIDSGSVNPVGFSYRLSGPWKLLMTTDGVWKYTGLETLVHIFEQSEIDGLIQALREAALQGKQLMDDFTLALLQSK